MRYSALDAERRRRNLRFNQLAVILDVNPATVFAWGHGVGLRSDHLAKVLMWLDRPLE